MYNERMLKKAEELIKKYPDECKNLTPEKLLFKLEKLDLWTDQTREPLPQYKNFIYLMRESVRTLNNVLSGGIQKEMSIPQALKSLQHIDDNGKLNTPSLKPTHHIGEAVHGESKWIKSPYKKTVRIVNNPNEIEVDNPREVVIEQKLSSVREMIKQDKDSVADDKNKEKQEIKLNLPSRDPRLL